MSDAVIHQCREARAATRSLARASSAQKDAFLSALAEALPAAAEGIFSANIGDLATARAAGKDAAFLDRLELTPARLNAIIAGVRAVAALPDPVGVVTGGQRRPNGLRIRRQRTPLGVIAIIFESRPNVVIEAATLCLKAGNACLLKGGRESYGSQEALIAIIQQALAAVGLPAGACQGVTADREGIGVLLQQDELIDVVIPRGGESLIRRVVAESRIPVIKHYKGVCHVYIDEGADLPMADAIAFNAKCHRYGVCNAMETLLVHAAEAVAFLPAFGERLRQTGVEIRGCERTAALIPGVTPATEADWFEEYLGPILAVRVVDSLDAALEHIERYGSRHTDAIVTRDVARANRFVQEVDSASVMVNASTRFADGFEYGLGAEIGISTDKLHARGPMGLESLTCEKWVVEGEGQVRI